MNHQQQQEQLHPHYQQKLQQNHHHHKPPQQELHHLQPLNIPNNAPESFTNNHRIQTEQSNIPPYIKPTTSRRMFVPPAESGNAVRPKGSNKLSSIDYIGPAPRGILTEDEAKRLINLFLPLCIHIFHIFQKFFIHLRFYQIILFYYVPY